MDARQQCRVARMMCWENLMNGLKSSSCEQLEAFLKEIPIQSRLGTRTAKVATNGVLRRDKCQSRSRIETGPGRKWNGSYTIPQSVWPKFKNPCKYPVFGTLQNPEKIRQKSSVEVQGHGHVNEGQVNLNAARAWRQPQGKRCKEPDLDHKGHGTKQEGDACWSIRQSTRRSKRPSKRQLMQARGSYGAPLR